VTRLTLEQLQHLLGRHVGLGQHRHARLLQDLVLQEYGN
jgi:hypothetical protein